MSWIEIAPCERQSVMTAVPVTFALSPRPGTKNKTIDALITIRTKLIDQAPKFLERGARVKLLVGVGGDHDGQARIVPGGKIPVLGAGGSRGADSIEGVMMIRFPTPDGFGGEKRQTLVEFDYGDDWLELAIPAWARLATEGATMPAPKAAPVAPPPHGKVPFEMAPGVKVDMRGRT